MNTFTFFLGYFNLDNITICSPILDNITFDDDILGDDCIIFLPIYVIIPLSVLGIILLSSIYHILDTEADFQERQRQKRLPRSCIIDLTYIVLPVNPGIRARAVFVYDTTDPSGLKMSSLFAGQGYDFTQKNGTWGYAGVNTNSLNQERELPMVTSPLSLITIERQGIEIKSNGEPIKKEVHLYGATPTTRLCVKENP